MATKKAQCFKCHKVGTKYNYTSLTIKCAPQLDAKQRKIIKSVSVQAYGWLCNTCHASDVQRKQSLTSDANVTCIAVKEERYGEIIKTYQDVFGALGIGPMKTDRFRHQTCFVSDRAGFYNGKIITFEPFQVYTTLKLWPPAETSNDQESKQQAATTESSSKSKSARYSKEELTAICNFLLANPSDDVKAIKKHLQSTQIIQYMQRAGHVTRSLAAYCEMYVYIAFVAVLCTCFCSVLL